MREKSHLSIYIFISSTVNKRIFDEAPPCLNNTVSVVLRCLSVNKHVIDATSQTIVGHLVCNNFNF